MPDIIRNDVDNLNAELTIKINKSDYESKFTEELKNYRKKSQIKGFRKGKAPMSFIRRTYGQSILIDIVNKKLQDEMSQYLDTEKIKYLGQPIPSESQTQFTFDTKQLEDFEFKFDIGLAPEFEFQNFEEEQEIPYYLIKVSDEMAREDLDKARRRMGKQEMVEEDIEKEDIIRMMIKETEDGVIKAGGLENEFSVVVKDLDEQYIDQILGKGKGLRLDIDIYAFEKDRDKKHVEKYLLGLDGEAPESMNHTFIGTITEINRIGLAEMNEEFFKSYFGNDEIKTEVEALEQLKSDIGKFYEKESDTLLFMQLRKKLTELNQIELPNEFLKRWLVTSSEENTVDKVEEGYNQFAQGLKWTMIQGELANEYDIEVKEEDLDKYFGAQVAQYLGMYANEEYISSTVARLKQDREQVNKAAEAIVGQKIFEKLKDLIKLEEKKVDMDEFRSIAEKEYAPN
ncbi:MAG: trigger factor [Bacteroidia bacterium]|nr:trigger factor [Bacteroidia bacterium]